AFGALRVPAKGEVDASGVRGVDPDLVVKPFGWKGTLAAATDFAVEALQVHHGIQSERLLATRSGEILGAGKDPQDPDDDGVRNELGDGPLAALAVHLALLELPIEGPVTQDRNLSPGASSRLTPTPR